MMLSVCALIALGAVAVAASTILHRSPSVRPVSQDAQPPVMLVPGYGGSTSGLDVLAKALRASGRTALVVDLGGDDRGDLRVQADHLDTAVRSELRRAGSRSVDLVGYSAGGVVVRLWVRDHDGGAVARRIVTLGSPQHGTDLAGLASDVAPDACPTACRQLSPESSLIRSLNTGDETPPGPRWVSIWTEDDKTVVPPESASLSGATDFSIQSVCPGRSVTHAGLPSDSVVITMTVLELGRAAPAVPGKSVCS
jgi:triacylglycerol esterase/lipase EstA (alpha/beta hydrolase family)